MRLRPHPMLSILPLAITACLLNSATGGEQRDPAKNAALQYWQALVNIPKNVRHTQWEIANRSPLTATMRDAEFLLETSGISAPAKWALEHLRQGADMLYCEWGLPLNEKGPHTLLHHTQRSSMASGLLLLSARLEQSRGDWDAAIGDLNAAWVFYRYLAHDGTTVSWANAHHQRVESIIAPLAASWVPQLDAKALRVFEQHIEHLPRLPPLSAIVLRTQDMHSEWMRTALDRERLKEVRERLLRSTRREGDEVRTAIQNATVNRDRLMDFIEKAHRRFDEAAAIAALPLDQFEPAAAQFEEEVRTGDPLSRWMLGQFGETESFQKLRMLEAMSKARLAMFRAAIALQREGRAGLKQVEEPFGPGPFTYLPSDGGFTLASALIVEGKPFSVRFGKGAVPDPNEHSQLLVYDTEADMAAEIADALETAKRENKRVLLQWGFNGCIPCYRVHAMLTSPDSLDDIVSSSYVLRAVDITNDENRRLAQTFQVELPGVPQLTVLDVKRTVLANSKVAEDFYAHGELNAGLLQAFLERWAIATAPANE